MDGNDGVFNLQSIRERARQRRSGSKVDALKEPRVSACNSMATEKMGHGCNVGDPSGLVRLEAENASLRECVAQLALQIQALRDRAATRGAPPAWRPFRTAFRSPDGSKMRMSRDEWNATAKLLGTAARDG